MSDMRPRQTGWVTVAEDRLHPRYPTLGAGDITYHVEHGIWRFLVYDPERDNYDSYDFNADDARVSACVVPGEETTAA